MSAEIAAFLGAALFALGAGVLALVVCAGMLAGARRAVVRSGEGWLWVRPQRRPVRAAPGRTS
ncbi:MAG TPA: hypothetical protein VHJ34_05505 [Actinomycetota bacterium]|nr:hypothetical protein [Actinomycetota bacterium]